MLEKKQSFDDDKWDCFDDGWYEIEMAQGCNVWHVWFWLIASVFFSGVQRLFLVLSETDWLKDPLKDIARNKLQESEKVCKYYKNKEILCVAPSVRGSSAHLDSSSVHTDFWVQTTLQNACRDDPLTYTSHKPLQYLHSDSATGSPLQGGTPYLGMELTWIGIQPARCITESRIHVEN